MNGISEGKAGSASISSSDACERDTSMMIARAAAALWRPWEPCLSPMASGHGLSTRRLLAEFCGDLAKRCDIDVHRLKRVVETALRHGGAVTNSPGLISGCCLGSREISRLDARLRPGRDDRHEERRA